MIKANIQIIIDFIITCLEKGEERGNILTKVGKKWGSSKSAVDRYLKIAKEQHRIKQETIKKSLAELDKQAALDARKKAIMTADERKEYLTKLIKGEVKVPYTEIKWNPKTSKFVKHNFIEVAPHSARISAISELNKMEGDYAPAKVAQTDVEGNNLKTASILLSLPVGLDISLPNNTEE